ncbi:hypothetical protein SARC_07557 [Sphaeroforma arctica JP610]|uniref:Uncharacterized protein n=1 Tax=Sphaeroforma arctica JP610 TaxID=667725 RepID=A0A0L0FTV4_9EUKA|nr:hypothetical protein SARC_07557 [Sphaeroforma arctica JP610]KNC80069.1 hypothetical protein SARC_07557 [Sphaeroforma arctica JP610]|eukprot:XP_014153971.1 hypothetical protein SARC_07557 [Sphaeroforma arctica JP610]
MKLHIQLAALALSMGACQGWWDIGHKTAAAIAQQLMKNEHSKKQMANILSYLDAIYTDESQPEMWTAGDRDAQGTVRPELLSSTMAQAASNPDVAKYYYNMNIFGEWHYINQKYDPEGLDTEDTGCNTATQVNAKTQFEDIAADVMSDYNGRQTARWYTHFGTIMLIHIISDVHQPYHAVGRCMMWEGELDQDLGGNRWTFTMPDGSSTNMHTFWDAGQFFWDYPAQAKLEATDPTYEKFAAELIAKYPVDTLAAEGYDTNFTRDGDMTQMSEMMTQWLLESKTIAEQSYEQAPVLGGPINPEYINVSHIISEKRVTIAGHRMAAFFDGLLANTEYPKYEAKTTGTEEQEFTNLNIHVKLSQECNDMATQYNQGATDVLGAGNNTVDFVSGLNEPHLTLYLTDFQNSHIKDVAAVINNFVWAEDCEIVLDHGTNTGTGYAFWDPNEVQPACLRKMADAIMEVTKAYIVTPTEEGLPTWIADLPEPERTEKTNAYWDFGSPNVGSQFQPHVTYAAVAYGGDTSKFDEVAEVAGTAAGSAVCTYIVSEIALGQTGLSGTVLTGLDIASTTNVGGAPAEAEASTAGESGDDSSSGTSAGVIGGCVIGGLVVGALIGGVAVKMMSKGKKSDGPTEESTTNLS